MTAIITIANKSDATIFATVESERRIIQTESDHQRTLRIEASGGGGSVGVKTPKGGVEFGGSGHTSATAEDVRSIARTYSIKHGPEAGFAKIAPGRQTELVIPGASADAYFLTLSDGEHVCAYRAPLDATDHDFIEVMGSGKTLHYDVSPDGLVIRSGDAISLKRGNRYVGNPSEAKNWPAGVMSSAAGAHKILNLSSGLVGPVKSGDVVKLKGAVLGDDKDYCFMYSSKKGWIYYDRASTNEKQQWIISKVGGAAGPIRSGDSVLLFNYYWRSAQLRPSGDWLACESGADSPFVIDVI